MTEEESNKKEGGRTKRDEIAEPEIIAPDGGWGWVIVSASFFMHLIGGYHDRYINITKSDYAVLVYGICYTFGMFLGEFMETFGTSRSATSMIGSIQIGVTKLMGPIAADLVNRFGCRSIAIAGSIISATSIIISVLAPNIATLYLTTGFFTGKL